jgi:hypothetical protein
MPTTMQERPELIKKLQDLFETATPEETLLISEPQN